MDDKKKLGDQMQQNWNERAQIDPLWAVLNRKRPNQWSLDEFLQAGEQDMHTALDPFCKQHSIRTKARTCLEIGCGAGRHSGLLAQRFKRVIGLDVSDAMLETARQTVTADNVEFVRGNGADLDVIESDSVSFVWSVIVFQHIPDPDIQYTYLREVGRVLRTNGWFLIHLYADKAHAEHTHAQWQKRADAGELMGWDELAIPELVDERWKTSTRTAVDRVKVLEALQDAGLSLLYETGQDTDAWWIGGKKA